MLPRRLWPFVGLLAFIAARVWAAEVIPAAPARYFNDYAGVVRPSTAESLNDELDRFERATSNQILVVVYPRMQSDSSIEDYTVRVAQAWGAGQKARSNGAVLFVFVQERALYVQTGYGLEGALPDALCKRIIEDEIVPHLRQGDFDAGLAAGVRALTAAAQGEYQGTGRTVSDRNSGGAGGIPWSLIFFVALIAWSMIRSRRHVVYGSGGRRGVWGGGSVDFSRRGFWRGRRGRRRLRRRLLGRGRRIWRRRSGRKLVISMRWLFAHPLGIDHARVANAIARAERRTGGEIHVLIARHRAPDPVAAAQRHFDRLGLARTADRDGVLIFVAPRSRTFAVIGDQGVHEKCGDGFWRALASAMEASFKKGEFTEGLVHGIDAAGALLAEHFPPGAHGKDGSPGDVREID